MRPALALALCLLAAPAQAWEFSPAPICTLTNDGEASLAVTYDPASGIYAIHLTHPDGWGAGPQFSIRFDGPYPLTIATGRHRVDGNTLTVTDSGFGNVLDGLQFNRTATAITGDLARAIDLNGAHDAVDRFRQCTAGVVS